MFGPNVIRHAQKISEEVEADLEKAMETLPRIKPPGQPPKIWKSIEKVNKEGKTIKFTIQEIPEDRHEDAVQHMYAKDDPAFVQDMSTIWRLLLVEGISIAAFTDNPNGGKPIIAGMNVLGLGFRDQNNIISKHQFKSQNCNTFVSVSDTKIVYDLYGIDKYLYALGLSVDPAYRGGLGKDILKIRDLIGREYNIPATATVFSSIIAQKSARDVGFELLTAKDFVDMVDENGKQYFPGVKSKTFEIMGKRLS